MLPIGVIIPTRNSIELLPQHLAAVKAWIAQVQEVICVDSFSEDGTLEMLKAELQHPRLRILSHPPGLYQSWNFAIQQVMSKYVHLATVGDSISLPGLRHLVQIAERFESQVVLSPPRFRSAHGEGLELKRWRIHDYLDTQKITVACILPRSHLFITSVFAGTSGMMGSSASNLYQTALLKRHPFPTDFAHIGDTAWGVQNALRVRAAITPERCADFVIHSNEGNFGREKRIELEQQLLTRAREALAAAITNRTVPAGAGALVGILKEYDFHHRQELAWDDEYYCRRTRLAPWFLDPRAWRARAARDRHRQILRNLWRNSLDRFAF
jgi:hypothetical protein